MRRLPALLVALAAEVDTDDDTPFDKLAYSASHASARMSLRRSGWRSVLTAAPRLNRERRTLLYSQSSPGVPEDVP